MGMEMVDSYKYLGLTIMKNAKSTLQEVKKYIKRSFEQLRLGSLNIPSAIRYELLRKVIMARILYLTIPLVLAGCLKLEDTSSI
jgi:hypothetical protein